MDRQKYWYQNDVWIEKTIFRNVSIDANTIWISLSDSTLETKLQIEI